MEKMVTVCLLAFGLAFAQEEPYQVPGFSSGSPTP